MKNQRRSETRMTLAEYFGEECAESIKELYAQAMTADQEERKEIAACLRAEAAKQQKDTVCIILNKLAEQIESIEVSE
ncbi:hypothetical protein [Enterococcus avium]|uniref:hypothetical protein n=1 Tax=Enterococcus avium TaxID=33945 RepID=UPI0022E3F707|nr:hypothetical protein [Enterococcus avium]